MKLSPLDIKKQEFTRTLRRGYDPDEVQAFLDMLASQWEEMLAEQRRTEDKVRELKAKMQHYEKVEEALQEALKTARENSQQKLDHAKREAALIVKEAFGEAEDIVRDAARQRDAHMEEIKELAGRRDEILAQLRAFLMSEAELLARFENRLVGTTNSRVSVEKKDKEGGKEDSLDEPEVETAVEETPVEDPVAVQEDPSDTWEAPDDDYEAPEEAELEEAEESDIFADVANAVKNAIVEQGVVKAVADHEKRHDPIPIFEPDFLDTESDTAELEALIDEVVPAESDDATLKTEELEEVLRKMAAEGHGVEDDEADEPAGVASPEIEVEVIGQADAPDIEVEMMEEEQEDVVAEAPEAEGEAFPEHTPDSFFKEDVPPHFAGEGDAMAFKFFESNQETQEVAKFFRDSDEAYRFSSDEASRKKGRAPSRSTDRSPADKSWNARSKSSASPVPEPHTEDGSIAPSEEVEKIRRILSDLE